MMRKNILLILLILLPLCAMAQGEEFSIVKGDCMPDVSEASTSNRASRRALIPMTNWDKDKTYRQMVVLFSFSDISFSMENPKDYYEKLFNQKGFNEGRGPGCVADYYRTQSDGLVNFVFDIFGPIQVSSVAQPYDSPTASTRNYGREPMREAVQKIIEENPDQDYSSYDWNGDGVIEQVIFIYAGPTGNTSQTYGYIWPNTSSFTSITTPDGKTISPYSTSAELWSLSTPRYCGIGTVCHEFSHSLGLPDIYPVGSSSYPFTSVDEWDLMDGGNFTNWGWCPPNYSPLEKMLLGWLTPTELSGTLSVTDMKAISEGGAVYQVKHTDNEYLLLENRQWTGWDSGIPGKGLVIYYVNYQDDAWKNNRVNSSVSEYSFRYRIIHADNLIYDEWRKKIQQEGISVYQINTDRWHSNLLSTSSYPYEQNNELTNTSVPAAQMSQVNASGETLLSKAIGNICMTDGGVVSFDFNSFELTRMADGISSVKGGMAGNAATPSEGKMLLTVKPNDGFCAEKGNITVVRSPGTNTSRAQKSDEETVEVSAVDASADPSGLTTYMYSYASGYSYHVTVDFQSRVDFSKADNKPTISLVAASYEYDGSAKEPGVTLVTYGDAHTEVNPAEYEVSYQKNKNAGVAEVHVTGKRHFMGSAFTTFEIIARNLTGIATIDKIADQEYTGEEIKPDPVVRDGEKTLVSGTDYDVSYSNNVDKGTATVEVHFKGNYSGTVSANFVIKEATDIGVIHMEDGKTGVLYDLSGQRVYIPLPGRTYVFKSKDGTAYKYIHTNGK